MKRKASTKKVLSIAKQKVKTAVQQMKQKVRAQRAVNLYERLIGINPTKKVVVSPMRVRRSLRRSLRRSVRRSPVLSQLVAEVQSPVKVKSTVRRSRRSRSRSATRSRSPKKM